MNAKIDRHIPSAQRLREGAGHRRRGRQPGVAASAGSRPRRRGADTAGAHRHRVRPAHRRDRGQRHRQDAHGDDDQRLAARAAAALARRRHGDACGSPTHWTRTRRSTGTASSCRPTWTASPVSASRASTPATAYNYRFTVKQNGTYWYHSHSGFQEQHGVYGPLVIEPREPEPFQYDREHVVMLTDWTDEERGADVRAAEEAVGLLQLPPAHRRDFLQDVRRHGLGATLAERGLGPDADERRRPRRRHRLHLHLPDERAGAGRRTGPGCSRRASGCGCGSSTARRCRTSTCASPA